MVGLCISSVLSQHVVFETRHTPLATQFTSTINANNFERAIWQVFEAELAIQKTLIFINFYSRRFVSSAIHNVTAALLPDIPNYWAV